MPDLSPPIPVQRLRQLGLALKKSVPTLGLGAHLRRRQGQSLQFREYRSYQMGDDIRAVDWRASARLPDEGALIVKTFEAEERMTLAVVVDVRPAMRLPLATSKLLVALWAMQALAIIAAEGGDDVVLGTMFGALDTVPIATSGKAAGGVARQLAQHIWDATGLLADEPKANPSRLIERLKPASAVVLITDGLFADLDGAVLRLAHAAQRSRRQFFVLELDSFDSEASAVLRDRPALLATVEGRQFPDHPADLTAMLANARQAIADLRRERQRLWSRGGMVWPDAMRFPEKPTEAALRAAFATVFPHSPVLRGIVARGLR